jgi:hypothetical protein
LAFGRCPADSPGAQAQGRPLTDIDKAQQPLGAEVPRWGIDIKAGLKPDVFTVPMPMLTFGIVPSLKHRLWKYAIWEECDSPTQLCICDHADLFRPSALPPFGDITQLTGYYVEVYTPALVCLLAGDMGDTSEGHLTVDGALESEQEAPNCANYSGNIGIAHSTAKLVWRGCQGSDSKSASHVHLEWLSEC